MGASIGRIDVPCIVLGATFEYGSIFWIEWGEYAVFCANAGDLGREVLLVQDYDGGGID